MSDDDARRLKRVDGPTGPYWISDDLADRFDVPSAAPRVQRVQQWCGYLIGALFLACLLVVMLAATFAAVRALLS